MAEVQSDSNLAKHLGGKTQLQRRGRLPVPLVRERSFFLHHCPKLQDPLQMKEKAVPFSETVHLFIPT